MKYWVNDHSMMIGYTLKAVNAVQDDTSTYAQWPVHIPQGLSAVLSNSSANVALLGARQSGTQRGLVQGFYGPTSTTPATFSSNMGWNEIFGDVGFSSGKNVVCTIEFSLMILRTV